MSEDRLTLTRTGRDVMFAVISVPKSALAISPRSFQSSKTAYNVIERDSWEGNHVRCWL